jgi:DNA mismatch endonuclease (patch repair protein)
VFVDGCFWHVCPAHWKMPARNLDYWTAKFARNVQRDREDTAELERGGWYVIRVWEHTPAIEAAALITETLERLGDSE